jgi:hypothetical protein
MPDAITFAAGAALCALLGSMQLRADRTAGRASGYLLLWVLGFIWTFGNFLRCTLALANIGPDTFAAKAAETLAWSCTLLGPVARRRPKQRSSARRWARWFVPIPRCIWKRIARRTKRFCAAWASCTSK